MSSDFTRNSLWKPEHRSDILTPVAIDHLEDGDIAVVCRRADYQRHFYGGHSVMYAGYAPEELMPACADWPCGAYDGLGIQACHACHRHHGRIQ